MDTVHASDEIVAQGSITPLPSDQGGTTGLVRLPTLYLDADSQFRWYEDGDATRVAGASLRTAIAAARLNWPRFQVIRLKGKAVVHLDEADVPNIHAADELDRTRKAQP